MVCRRHHSVGSSYDERIMSCLRRYKDGLSVEGLYTASNKTESAFLLDTFFRRGSTCPFMHCPPLILRGPPCVSFESHPVAAHYAELTSPYIIDRALLRWTRKLPATAAADDGTDLLAQYAAFPLWCRQ